MLMSSVTVQQATLRNEQAAVTARLAEDTARQASASAEQALAATRITALAFVYIPLTFVTGIFGMNIRTSSETPNGFIWYAPLVRLGVAIVFTIALWIAASWIEKKLAERRGKRRSDVEKGGPLGRDLKAKYE
jgi:Mg2+ and Co2+ transporter CorA